MEPPALQDPPRRREQSLLSIADQLFGRKKALPVPVPVAVTGLILSGGGARAAYQVGVLKAVADLLPCPDENPFQVVVGTSAGAINAVSLACGAIHFQEATRQLERVWQNFTSNKVYRTDWPGVLRQASRFSRVHLLGLGRSDDPLALLDNGPLHELLASELDFAGISLALARRKLKAVGITAFAYQGASSVTFYQSRGTVLPWARYRRQGVPVRLKLEHLLASAAIPLLFPPVRLDNGFYGDGAVRQSSPVSPALHLGANRILVVGVNSRLEEQQDLRLQLRAPSLAQIGGHLLNSTFADNLDSDLELLQRLNQLGGLIKPEFHHLQEGLAPVEILVIQPSQVIDDIAVRHRHQLPSSIRTFLRGPGATRSSGGGVLSYLLFEKDYCAELIELGYQDAIAQKERLQAFLRPCRGQGTGQEQEPA